uniref:Uncharacterized protein n=1 Tax=Meloidogyne enterolobii TaxID=390850 RepID=A0A6V7UND6_MELEN|nr:unnamed protein product [Meloidogyne enterolobii]
MFNGLPLFATQLLNGPEEGIYWRLSDDLKDRRRVELEVRKLLNKGSSLLFWNKFLGEKTIQKIECSDWFLVKDKGSNSVKPNCFDYFEYELFCARNRQFVEKYMTPEESQNLIVGPGILVENEFNGDEEFYPLECLGIDIINYPYLLENETENLGLSSLEVDVDVISGDLKNLNININNNNTIQLQTTLNADIHSDGGNTNVGITEIKTKITIWKKATTILLLFLLITGTVAGPEKNNKKKDLDDLLNDLLEDEDIVDMSNNNLQNTEVQLFSENINNNNNNIQTHASVVTRPQAQTSEGNKQIVHVFEQILESWIATRPMSSSTAASATNSLQSTPSTSQTTITPTTAPPIATIVPQQQQQLPFEQENPFPQQQSAAGPIRNSYNNNRKPVLFVEKLDI